MIIIQSSYLFVLQNYQCINVYNTHNNNSDNYIVIYTSAVGTMVDMHNNIIVIILVN